jgi:imidazolonepropionase-like amidohydrolase
MRSLPVRLFLTAGLAALTGPHVVHSQSARPAVLAITNATVLTVTKGTVQRGTVLVRDGRIVAVGADVAVARDAARKASGALARAGLAFGFSSDGLKDPKDLVENARVVVRNGLDPETAVRALTLDAARLGGLGSRLGSIERGRRANLIVTDGDLLADKTKVRHVFVAGRLIQTEP